jgi:hypothetical protein
MFMVIFITLLIIIFNGITLDNLVYKNIHIKKLYLRYDNSLLLDIDELRVYNGEKEVINITTVLNITYNGGVIKKLKLKNKELSLKGKLIFNIEDILDNKNNSLIINDFDFMFNPKLAHLKSKRLDLAYLNNKIILKFKDLTYDSIPLKGSDAIIKNIISKKDTVLYIQIKSKSLLQTKFLNILNYYKIKLPFYQMSGQNDIIINLTIPFSKKPFKVYADIKSYNTKIAVNNIIIPVKQLKVILDKNTVVTNMIIDDNNQSLLISNTTNVIKNSSYGEISIKNLKFLNLFSIKNKKYDYSFNIDENILIIPEIGLYYTISPKHDYIYIKYLEKVLNIIPFLSSPIGRFSDIYIDSKNNFQSTSIEIKDLYLKVDDKYFKNKKDDNNSKVKLPLLNIKMTNGEIRYKKYNFKYDKFLGKVNLSRIDIEYFKNKSSIILNTNIDTNSLHIKSVKLEAEDINSILEKKIFEGGYISFQVYGNLNKVDGSLKLYNTLIRDLPLLNNLIIFINTTPAIINPLLVLPTLFRLGETKFNTTGYLVQKGLSNFKYNMINNNLNLSKIYLKSNMMDFSGVGDINLENNQVNLKVNAIFLKDYSKIISYIPIVGYIILGDDGNFITQVDINGTVNKPIFHSNLIKDSFKGFENWLKRILIFPFKLFDINSSSNETIK